MTILMKRRTKQPNITRQAILDAAGWEFSFRGYAGTGIEPIVSRAELTKGALFHHFPDKRTLAAAWIREDLAAAMARLWADPLEDIGSLDSFRAHCRTRCLELQPGDAPSALVALTAETAGDPILGEALGDVFGAWKEAVTRLLERGKTEGWIHRSIQPATEAEFLVAAFSGFTVAARIGTEEPANRGCAAALEGYLETLRAQ